MARTTPLDPDAIEDAPHTEQERSAGRTQNSPVYQMLPRVVSAQNAEDKTGAVRVPPAQVRAARNGLHGAATDLGVSVDIKQHPQADGKVKLVFTVIPRRKAKGRPKGSGATKKPTASRKA